MRKDSLNSVSPSSGRSKGKTAVMRKLLGEEFDEKILDDPQAKLRAQVIKDGYYIPSEFSSMKISEINTIDAFEIYRRSTVLQDALDFTTQTQRRNSGSAVSNSKQVGSNASRKFSVPSKDLIKDGSSRHVNRASFSSKRNSVLHKAMDNFRNSLILTSHEERDKLISGAQSKQIQPLDLPYDSASPFDIDIILNLNMFLSPLKGEIEIYTCLYDADSREFITEECLIDREGLRVIFRKIGPEVFLKPSLYLIFRVYRNTSLKKEDKKLTQAKYRRPFGGAVLSLYSRMESLLSFEEVECPELSINVIPLERNHGDIHNILINDNERLLKVEEDSTIGFTLKAVKISKNEVLHAVNEEDKNCIVVSPINRMDTIFFSSKKFNYFYIKSIGGEFEQLKKTTALNIQISVQVCDESGKPVPNCISRAKNMEFASTFRSVVYYHVNNPVHNEQLIVMLPDVSELSRYHVYFEIRHSSSKLSKQNIDPIGFTFLPLMPNEQFSEDRIHRLVVYKYRYKYRPPYPLFASSGLSHTFSLNGLNVEKEITEAPEDPALQVQANDESGITSVSSRGPSRSLRESLSSITGRRKSSSVSAANSRNIVSIEENEVASGDVSNEKKRASFFQKSRLSIFGRQGSAKIDESNPTTASPNKKEERTSKEPYSSYGAYICIPTNQVLSIQTKLCSNQVAHDPHIIRLHRWRSLPKAELSSLIIAMSGKPIELRLNYLQLIFDTLFDIMSADASSEIQEMVCDAIFEIIADISQDKDPSAIPVLLNYIDSISESRQIHWNLMEFFSQTFEYGFDDVDRSKTVLLAGKYVIKLVLKFWNLSKESKDQLKKLAHSVCSGITLVIGEPENPGLSIIRPILLDVFLDIMHGFHLVFSQDELYEHLHEFYKAIPVLDQNLVILKLQHMEKVFSHPILEIPGLALSIIINVLNNLPLHFSGRISEQNHCVGILFKLLVFVRENSSMQQTFVQDIMKKKLFAFIPIIFRYLCNNIKGSKAVGSGNTSTNNHRFSMTTSPSLMTTTNSPMMTIESRKNSFKSVGSPSSKKQIKSQESGSRGTSFSFARPPSVSSGVSPLKSLMKPGQTVVVLDEPVEVNPETLQFAVASFIALCEGLRFEDFVDIFWFSRDASSPNVAAEIPGRQRGSSSTKKKVPFRTSSADIDGDFPTPSANEKTVSSHDDHSAFASHVDNNIRIQQIFDVLLAILENQTISEKDQRIVLRAKEVDLCVRFVEYFVKSRATESEFDASSAWKKIWKLITSLLHNKTVSGKIYPKFCELLDRDYRESIISCAFKLWERTPKSELFGDLVDLIIPTSIRLSLSTTLEDLKLIMLQIYFDLLILEIESKGHPDLVESYTIDTIDDYTCNPFTSDESTDQRSYNPSIDEEVENYLKLLQESALKCSESRGLSSSLTSELNSFISGVKEQFRQLLSLQRLGTDLSNEDMYVDAISRLMELFQAKPDLYERYVLHLVDFHRAVNNNVEVAEGLLLYASSLKWSYEKVPAFRKMSKESSMERKARILKEAVGYFQTAKYFEKAIDVYRELVYAYEKLQFDYFKSVNLHKTMATALEQICNEDRLFPSFFRVAFYGLGFPADLRGKEFVYRSGNSGDTETVIDFTNRIKSQYPGAKFYNSPDPMPEDGDGRSVQITTLLCSSKDDLEGRIPPWEEPMVPLRVKTYLMQNEIDHFKYSYVYKGPESRVELSVKNDFSHLWVKQVFIKTKMKFPYISRRQLVDQRIEVIVSPMENAINSLRSKNRELFDTILQVQSGAKSGVIDVGPLTMILNGVIDAAVQGGVKKYREAFFESNYFSVHTEHQKFVPEFQRLYKEQLLTVQRGLDVFEQNCNEKLRPLYQHLLEMFEKMKDEEQNFISLSSPKV